MRIATWNINGIKAREPVVLQWLEQQKPDIVCLQEIKSLDENFPRATFESLGYNVETFGQKSWNGVAILSRTPFEEVHRGLPGDDGDEGAANHTRLGEAHGKKGVEIFTYGASSFSHGDGASGPQYYPARQRREASEAVARLHGLDAEAELSNILSTEILSTTASIVSKSVIVNNDNIE